MYHNDFVEMICGEGWNNNEADRNGGYGVAIVVAFIKGVKPELPAIASYLKLKEDELRPAFNNLFECGVFSTKFNAKKDNALLGRASDAEIKMAWGQISGLASSLIYQKLDD
jgi:hypothetical protein